MSEWGFITNHGLVLATVAMHPRSTARGIGDEVGITERAAHKIINDLEEDGYVKKKKVGRKNHYRIDPEMPIKDEIGDVEVGELLTILGWKRRKRHNKNNSTNSTKDKKA